MFVNFSNHPSSNWERKQSDAAKAYGGIIDLAFPLVAPDSEPEEIAKLGEQYLVSIAEIKPQAVLCQGEFTLAYYVICQLKKQGIPVVAACSQRECIETICPDGTVKRESYFRFVRFREYRGEL